MIVGPSAWLFFPGKSKQANKDYQALQRDEVGEETDLLAKVILDELKEMSINLSITLLVVL